VQQTKPHCTGISMKLRLVPFVQAFKNKPEHQLSGSQEPRSAGTSVSETSVWGSRWETPSSRPSVRVTGSVVTRCADASKRVSSHGGGVSSKRVSRLASFRGGAKNDDVRSLAARLYHVTASGSGSDFAGRFYSNINPSGSIQHVGCWLRVWRV